ncbi:hypothetical protein GMES_3156 [Paraglaciecola mesophila KMM 241]|uniref:Uncharacterized protein n=1 Tax=Paraglaciecola mesophila KMM 241 TaxID=1128912 RepID=K6YN79_9ALTE|nr:hypothetical protein GMES_3156 [Paraglaciecola mesophila KMM 241]
MDSYTHFKGLIIKGYRTFTHNYKYKQASIEKIYLSRAEIMNKERY